LFLSCAFMSLVRFLLRLILADLYLDSFLLFFWRCTCINSRLRSRLRYLWCLSLNDIYRLLLFHLYIIISLYSRLNLWCFLRSLLLLLRLCRSLSVSLLFFCSILFNLWITILFHTLDFLLIELVLNTFIPFIVVIHIKNERKWNSIINFDSLQGIPIQSKPCKMYN